MWFGPKYPFNDHVTGPQNSYEYLLISAKMSHMVCTSLSLDNQVLQ